MDRPDREFATRLAERDTDQSGESPEQHIQIESVVYKLVKRDEGPFQERIGVGRTRNVDIQLPFGDVSKYHAYFTREEDGYSVADARSTNGTFVDYERLEPGDARPLKDGDVVAFGPYTYVFASSGYFFDLIGRVCRRG